jgi:hypothetical protein
MRPDHLLPYQAIIPISSPSYFDSNKKSAKMAGEMCGKEKLCVALKHRKILNEF